MCESVWRLKNIYSSQNKKVNYFTLSQNSLENHTCPWETHLNMVVINMIKHICPDSIITHFKYFTNQRSGAYFEQSDFVNDKP